MEIPIRNNNNLKNISLQECERLAKDIIYPFRCQYDIDKISQELQKAIFVAKCAIDNWLHNTQEETLEISALNHKQKIDFILAKCDTALGFVVDTIHCRDLTLDELLTELKACGISDEAIKQIRITEEPSLG